MYSSFSNEAYLFATNYSDGNTKRPEKNQNDISGMTAESYDGQQDNCSLLAANCKALLQIQSKLDIIESRAKIHSHTYAHANIFKIY